MAFVNIYDYFNYRQYLEDYYIERKKVDPKFSYRYFALRAGYNSSGYYPNLVKGLHNLTQKYIPKFIKALELNQKDAAYFSLLVEYDQARTFKLKQNVFEKIITHLPKDIKRITHNQKEFYSKWHHVAIHQALDILDFKNDYKELATFINPNLKIVEVKKSVVLLKDTGLAEVNKEGYLKPSSKGLVGGEEVGKVGIHEFQASVMELAKDATSRFPAEDRHVITNTMTLNEDIKNLIKEKIETLQKEIVDLSCTAPNLDQVFQLNIQFFPLSNKYQNEN